MICRHCGKELLDNANFCQNCGTKVKKTTNTSNKKSNTKKIIFPVLFTAIFYGLLLTFAAFSVALMPPLLVVVVIVGVIYTAVLVKVIQKNIGYIPNKDNIEKCNRCGSTNIKVYRKGYNYHTGFWGAIFGVRGSGYAGGFDANKACCRCMDCGNDWETDYDYRLINK